MTCKNCPYYWQDESESFPSCKFESAGSWDPAPCENDD